MKNNFLKYWLPLYIYAGIIFYFSGIAKPLPEVSIPFFDKFLHICEYGIFGILAVRAFKKGGWHHFKIFAILLSVLYGISDEFHQAFVSERQFSMFDILADGIGGMMGVLIYCKILNEPLITKH